MFIAPLGFYEDLTPRSLVEFGTAGSDVLYVATCRPVFGTVERAFDNLVVLVGKQGFPEPIVLDFTTSTVSLGVFAKY